jgi:hypothetical protein
MCAWFALELNDSILYARMQGGVLGGGPLLSLSAMTPGHVRSECRRDMRDWNNLEGTKPPRGGRVVGLASGLQGCDMHEPCRSARGAPATDFV